VRGAELGDGVREDVAGVEPGVHDGLAEVARAVVLVAIAGDAMPGRQDFGAP
jgi:hypothetical protein